MISEPPVGGPDARFGLLLDSLIPIVSIMSQPMQITDATVLMAFQVRKKDPVVAFLLWWFLGIFGGHRFYCNRGGTGAAMLVTTILSLPLCYVCVGFVTYAGILVWWIVDAFLISGWIQEHNQQVMNQLEYARYEQSIRSLPMSAGGNS